MEKIIYFEINDHLDYVLLVSNDDIYFLYEKIREYLKKGKKSVLVDLFYRNGYSFNRFIELNYLDDSKVESMLVNPREVPEEIKANTKMFFRNHMELLERATLVDSVKNFVIVAGDL